MRLRRAAAGDSGRLAEIYAPFVLASAVSFEVRPPDEAEMRARLDACGDRWPWLVAEDEAGVLLGFASASAFRARPAYRFTVETSVYLDEGTARRGVGTALYRALLHVLEAQGFTQAIAAIVPPNEASERLHAKLGFTRAGTYEKVGWKLGRWWSVALWQRALAPAGEPPAEPKPVSAAWPLPASPPPNPAGR